MCKRLLTICLFFYSGMTITVGQSNAVVDSLEIELSNEKVDSNQYKLLAKMVKEVQSTDRSQAVPYLKRLIDAARLLEDSDKEASALRDMGRNYLYLNDNDKALPYLEEAYDIRAEQTDTAEMNKVLANLALIHQRENRYEEATSMYLSVIDYAKRNKNYGTAIGQLINVASIYIDQENYDAAIRCLDEIDEIYESIPDDAEEKESLSRYFPLVNINRGICFMELQEYAKAFDSYEKTLKAADILDNSFNKIYYSSYALQNTGDLYLYIKKKAEDNDSIAREFIGDSPEQSLYELARGNLQEALNGFRKIKNERGIIFTKNSLGKALAGLGLNITAEQQLLEALDSAQNLNFKEEIRDAYEYLSFNAEMQQDYQAALDYHKLFLDFKDTIIRSERIAALAEQETKYQTLEKETEIVRLAAENEVQARKQALSNALFIGAILGLLGLGYILYTRYRLRQQKKAAEFEKNLSQAMARFVPMKFINALGKEKITDVNLGDQIEKEVTVVFTDIRNFTSISEKLTPRENFKLVKDYAEKMGPIILKHRGFINQYMGDGIMAIFDRYPDDALRACIEMQKAVTLFSKDQHITDIDIRVGMGMHTGNLVLGIIGDEDRRDAALISDTVNSAARMETSTKHLGARIILSEESVSNLDEPEDFKLRYIGEYKAPGKEEPLKLYECYDTDPEEVQKLKESTKELFDKAMIHYRDGRYDLAIESYQEVLTQNPNDHTSQKYIILAQSHLQNVLN